MKASASLLILFIAGCSSAGPEPVSSTSPNAQPEVIVDFRAQGWTGPVLDQAFVGACGGFAVTAVMNSLLRRSGREESVSAMHVWAELKLRGGMAHDLINVAIAPAEAWAYDPVKACLIAEAGDPCASAGYRPGSGQLDPLINLEWVRANMAERHRVVGIETVYSTVDSEHQDKEVLFQSAARGEALDATILVADGFRSAGAVLSDYPVDDTSVGHGVAIVGFRSIGGERQLLLQNSWGVGWGDGGFAWLPERLIGRQLINARRLTLADARAPLPPANGQCDGWHHLDQVLDACFATCRNHLRTVNGRCNPMPKSEAPIVHPGCLHWRDIVAGHCRPEGVSLPTFPWL